jgi:Zinc finger, C3HC4 type (RING finger)
MAFGRKLSVNPHVCALCNKDLTDMSHVGGEPPAEETIQLPCKHLYHSLCLRGWTMVGKKDTCPTCLEKTDLRALYAGRPWEARNLQYNGMLDFVRYMVVWFPIIMCADHAAVCCSLMCCAHSCAVCLWSCCLARFGSSADAMASTFWGVDCCSCHVRAGVQDGDVRAAARNAPRHERAAGGAGRASSESIERHRGREIVPTAASRGAITAVLLLCSMASMCSSQPCAGSPSFRAVGSDVFVGAF